MNIFVKLLAFLALMICAGQMVQADDNKLTVKDAWSRPLILLNRPGAAYFTIVNDTDTDDRLISATSPLADRVELHVHKNENGVMKMLQVDAIPVAAHSKTVVKPGGYHLMIFGLKQKLGIGDEVPLILTFEHAGEIKVTAVISKRALVLSGEKMNHDMHKH